MEVVRPTPWNRTSKPPNSTHSGLLSHRQRKWQAWLETDAVGYESLIFSTFFLIEVVRFEGEGEDGLFLLSMMLP
jgi:hypothetical protein